MRKAVHPFIFTFASQGQVLGRYIRPSILGAINYITTMSNMHGPGTPMQSVGVRLVCSDPEHGTGYVYLDARYWVYIPTVRYWVCIYLL